MDQMDHLAVTTLAMLPILLIQGSALFLIVYLAVRLAIRHERARGGPR